MLVRRFNLVTLFLMLSALGATAQELAGPNEAPAYQPVTTVDPQIPLDQLQIMVKPLTKSELEGEAEAWFELLHSKARQIAAARLGVKKTNEAIDAEDATAAEESLKSAEAVRKTIDAEAERTEQELTKAAQQRLGVKETEADDGLAADEGAEPDSDDNASEADETSTDESPSTDVAPDEVTAEDQPVDDGETAASSDSDESSEAEPQIAAATGETQGDVEALKEEMLADIAELQDKRTALSDRLKVVLDSLERKGGDAEEYRSYIKAVSGIELDTSDAGAAWAGITGWLSSKEGGLRLARNIGKFFLILVLTYLVAKIVAAVVNWLLERKLKLSQLAERLISSTIRNIILLIGFAVALAALEVNITPVLAAIGAAGLVIGLALQGTLSNLASGLMILINRPFDVGNVVTAGGVTGVVDQMNLVSTTFRTFDNQTIHVPNNEIWNNVITNITANPTRRVDLEFGIGYDDDFEKAEQIIRDVVTNHELVHEDPEPAVVTHALADSSVNIVCRPWANTSDWWKVKTDVTREVKRRFDEAGITIPYPQQDIHVYNAVGEKGSYPPVSV